MGERLPCTQEADGSIPFTSTIYYIALLVRERLHTYPLTSRLVSRHGSNPSGLNLDGTKDGVRRLIQGPYGSLTIK